MKKLITYNKSFFIAFLISLGLSFAKIAFGQSEPPAGCDASFRDITAISVLPANIPWNNLVVLEANNNGYLTYTWDFGDGSSDTGRTVIHHFPKEGQFLVTLKVYSPNIGVLTVICEDKKSQWITVGPKTGACDASFQPKIICTTSIPPICSVVGFEATQKEYLSYKWDFGDGSIDTGASVNHSFTQEGRYLVTLNVLGKECEASQSQLFTKSGPHFPNPDSTLCTAKLTHSIRGNTVEMQDEIVRMTLVYDGISIHHTWAWGDGTISNGTQKDSHAYAKPGKYLVKVTKTALFNPCYDKPNCKAMPLQLCSQQYTYEVTIGENLETLCAASIAHADSGLKVTFYNGLIIDHFRNDVIERYTWDFGDGTSGEGTKSVHYYSSPGHYKVKLTKTVLIDPCPPLPGDVQCKALPYEVCSKVYEENIYVGASLCKAHFKIDQVGNKITVTTDKASFAIGYAKLDFGDGDVIESGSSYIKATHTYTKAGSYPICFRMATVTDEVLPYVYLPYYCTDTFCDSVTIAEQNLGNQTGISDPTFFQENNVRVYPNPAQNKLAVEVKYAESDLILQVFEESGKKTIEFSGLKTGLQELDIAQLDNGLYFYTLQDKEKIVRKGKIMVSK